MSDNSGTAGFDADLESAANAAVGGLRLPGGQTPLGTNELQQNVDSLASSVTELTSTTTQFVTKIGAVVQQAENASSGASQVSSGIASGARAGSASGTGTGGYAAWAKGLTTFGNSAKAAERVSGLASPSSSTATWTKLTLSASRNAA